MARVMVIDDEESIRSLFQIALEGKGHEVETAPEGKAALSRLRESPVDVVVTDLLMPEKEGLETIVELRREHPTVKIIAISGGILGDAQTYLHMARSLGASRTFSKPLHPGELTSAVTELMGV